MNLRHIQTIASSAHALYITTTAGLYLCGYDIDYSYSLMWSMAYFLIDLVYLATTAKSNDSTMMIHHGIGIVALIPNLFTPNPIYYYISAIGFLSEISTVPLNICWYLHDTQQTSCILYKPMGFTTIILYIPFRLICSPYVVFLLFDNRYWVLLPFAGLLTMLNYIWFFKLLKRAIKLN
jgi:hypothetical protein